LKNSFVHLHVHSDRSALDSILRIPDLVKQAKSFGMPAVAVTDHGVVSGAVQLIKQCKEHGIKPLVGSELYLSPTDDHTLREKIEGLPPFYHITCLAINSAGIKQLYKLSSIGFLEGFYHKPRVSIKLIEEIGKDLIVLGGCIKGPVSWNIKLEKYDLAEKFLVRLKESFKDRFFTEVMDHGDPEQKAVNQKLLEYENRFGVKAVPTNDAHFLTREDHATHCIMMCLQLKKTLEELKNSKMMYSAECHLKSSEEMIALFGEDLCKRTFEISERIDIQMDLGKIIFPNFQIPTTLG